MCLGVCGYGVTMLTMEVVENGRGRRVEVFGGSGQADETVCIRIIIGEILWLLAYIDFPLFLFSLELWCQTQINYSVTSIGVDLHIINTGLDSGYWNVKFSVAS